MLHDFVFYQGGANAGIFLLTPDSPSCPNTIFSYRFLLLLISSNSSSHSPNALHRLNLTLILRQ